MSILQNVHDIALLRCYQDIVAGQPVSMDRVLAVTTRPGRFLYSGAKRRVAANFLAILLGETEPYPDAKLASNRQQAFVDRLIAAHLGDPDPHPDFHRRFGGNIHDHAVVNCYLDITRGETVTIEDILQATRQQGRYFQAGNMGRYTAANLLAAVAGLELPYPTAKLNSPRLQGLVNDTLEALGATLPGGDTTTTPADEATTFILNGGE